MKNIIQLFICLLWVNCVFADVHWDYAGQAGPEHWGELDEKFVTCKLGHEQSPIDISTNKIEPNKLEPIQTSYQLSDGEIVNTGHAIQINLSDAGHVTLLSGDYKFVQFHLHTPSEEKIDGKNFPLVMHLVHKNSEGRLAVIAVLAKSGKANSAVQEVLSKLPSKGKHLPLGAGFDLNAILPSSLGAYVFDGSLTTPPCSEHVQWYVLKHPIELSKAQIRVIRKRFKMNARPTQPLNGRKIFETNE